MPAKKQTPISGKTLHLATLVSIFIMTVSFIATDLYLPSLPAISTTFASSKSLTQLTMTAFLLSFSLMQLIYGPLSDRYGRRPILLISTAILIFSSIVCTFAPTMELLILGRFLQGIGASAAAAIARVLVRDLFDGKRFAQMASYMAAAVTLTPALAPIAGGYIQHEFGFRVNFAVITCYAVLILALVYWLLPETNQNLNPDATRIKLSLQNYWYLITHKTFIGNVLCSGLAFAGIIAYSTVNPFLLQNVLHVTPDQYGLLTFIISLGLMLGMLVNSRLINHFSLSQIMVLGMTIMLVAGILLLTTGVLHYFSIVAIIIPSTLFACGVPLVLVNAASKALLPFPQMAGTAGALYGCIQILISSLTSALVSLINSQTQIPLAIIFIGLGSLSLIIYYSLLTDHYWHFIPKYS